MRTVFSIIAVAALLLTASFARAEETTLDPALVTPVLITIELTFTLR